MDYDYGTLIGEGSFGKVFKGRCKKDGTVVALKVIPKVKQSSEDLKILRQEFDIQRGLRHPNIVRVIEAFETKTEFVIVTEYVPGGELRKIYDRQRKKKGIKWVMPKDIVKKVATNVLSALYYLHSHRIVHRDIKPQNILLDKEFNAKLCDFGFAKILSPKDHFLTSIKGTPLYMAPELMVGGEYDESVDIWSVGCILYELCVGHPPFQTKDLIQLIHKVRFDSINYPDEFIGETCKDFLKGLLEKESRKRAKWPQILKHPFVADYFNANPPKGNRKFSLTKTMTDSQEMIKEIQRQEKIKSLPSGAQSLVELAKKKLEGQNQAQIPCDNAIFYQRSRRNSDTNLVQGLADFQAKKKLGRSHSDTISLKQFQNSAYHILVQQPVEKRDQVSPEKLEGVDKDEETLRLFQDNSTLHPEEWMDYLTTQLQDAKDDVTKLNNQNFIHMVIKPLSNIHVTKEIIVMSIHVLSTPFLIERKLEETLLTCILQTYEKCQVLFHLLLSLEGLNEDIEALEMMLTLISRLLVSELKIRDQFLSYLRGSEACRRSVASCLESPRCAKSALQWLIMCSQSSFYKETYFEILENCLNAAIITSLRDDRNTEKYLDLMFELWKKYDPNFNPDVWYHKAKVTP